MDFTPEDLAGYPAMEQMPSDYKGAKLKIHTIRSSNRIMPGEWVRLYYWEGRPYRSKHVYFMPPVQIIWKLQIEKIGLRIFLGSDKIEQPIEKYAHNDGLELQDFLGWFPEKFEGFVYFFSLPH